MEISIRQATVADVAQLAQLRWDFKTEEHHNEKYSHDEFIAHCTKWLRDGLQSRLWTYWIACNNTEIVSHIFVYTIPKVPAPDNCNDAFGYVTNVYTKPSYRNKGIGTLLVKHVQQWATEKNFELLIVWPSEPSKQFYKRTGFKEPDLFFEYTV